MAFTEEQKLTDHLQHFIACQTISNEDLDKVDWREFTKLHALLEAYYPVIYKLFEVIPVGRAGLLFHYDSGHPEKTPLVLSAHQDVVEPGALELWKKEPFSGAYEDGIIWGRGTTDCKHLFLAEM
ncbi:MAG: M20/M25/M40 family metallo-hydrolase, partial [Caecibacter massiliensis]|nr:M20/M25/M40 family metallo-hydrolase [Caecibacter massiliensis]